MVAYGDIIHFRSNQTEACGLLVQEDPLRLVHQQVSCRKVTVAFNNDLWGVLPYLGQ